MSTLLTILRRLALFAVFIVALIACAVALLYGMTRWSASEGEPMLVTESTPKTRPLPEESERLQEMTPASSAQRDQILFGDLHRPHQLQRGCFPPVLRHHGYRAASHAGRRL